LAQKRRKQKRNGINSRSRGYDGEISFTLYYTEGRPLSGEPGRTRLGEGKVSLLVLKIGPLNLQLAGVQHEKKVGRKVAKAGMDEKEGRFGHLLF